MYQLRLVYKVFISVFISLLFVACGSDDTVSEEQTPVTSLFHPIDVKKISYPDGYKFYFGGDILVHDYEERDFATLDVERIIVDAENKTLGSINIPYTIEPGVYQYPDTVLINDNIVLNILEESNDSTGNEVLKFDTYKIEDNDTITKLNTNFVNTELDGYTQWNVNVNQGFLKNNLLALSLSSSYRNDSTFVDEESVVLFRQDENNSFSYLQTLENDDPNKLFGYNAIEMGDNNIIAVSQECQVNIYAPDINSSLYHKTDVYVVESNYCSLSLSMSKNHLFVYHGSRSGGEDLLLTLDDNGKIVSVDDVTDSNVSIYFGSDQLALEDSLFVSTEDGFNVYTITQELNGSSHLVKEREIALNYYPNIILNGDSTFLSGNKLDSPYMDFFEAYPQDRLYVLNDTNTTQYLDEGNVYPFYKIAASSIHEPVTYSLSGDDSEYFTIVDNAIVPKAALNYENPVDIDANNIYEITLNIRDAQGHKQDLDFHVHLRDRDYVTKAVSYSDDNATKYLYLGKPLYLNKGDLVVGSKTDLYLFKVDENNLTQLATTTYTTEASYIAAVAKVNDSLLAGFTSYETNNSIVAGAIGIYTYEDTNNTLSFNTVLLSPQPTKNGLFGSQILVDNNTTIISEPGTYLNVHYESTGKVYIYNSEENATFTLQQTLQAPNMEQSNAFGESISMDGDYLLVGAPGSSSWSGAAYLYKKDANGSMVYLTTLLPSGDAIVKFGTTVALSGSYFVISAYSSVQDATNLYIYKIDTQNDTVGLVSIIYNALVEDSDSFVLEGSDILIAKYGEVAGYDRVQNIIDHYQIAEDGQVNLKERVVDHIIQSTSTRSSYQIVSDGDAVVVGNIMTNVGDVYSHGSLTLYKKDQ